MAAQAKRSNVSKVALSATLGYRLNVIRIPQALAKTPLQPPELKQRMSRTATRALQPLIGRQRINSALGTNASVTQQNLFTKIGWLRA